MHEKICGITLKSGTVFQDDYLRQQCSLHGVEFRMFYNWIKYIPVMSLLR